MKSSKNPAVARRLSQLIAIPVFVFRRIRLLVRRRPLLPLLFSAVLINALVGYVAFDAAQSEVREVSAARAKAFAIAIAQTVDRRALVPKLVSSDQRVLDLLNTPNPADAQALNQRLSETAAETGTEVLYILDRDGNTIASSNWDQPESFVGRNFAFRPYFQSAVAGKPGQYIALGTTSRRLGYYLSHPVVIQGRFSGAVVAKLGLDVLEGDWGVSPDITLVADNAGVVLLTNRPEWRFRTLHPLTQAERDAINVSQRYPFQNLTPLPIEFSNESAILRSGADAGNYLVSTIPLAETNSRIYVLSAAEPVWMWTVIAVVLADAVLTMIAAASYVFLERRRVRVTRRRERESRMRDILERKVNERTAELQLANHRLQEAQGELIHSAKLAALGQMSASLAHELSQPISAIRGFAENGLVLVERGCVSEVSSNFGEVVAMTERIGRITQHLKAFARRATQNIERVQLRPTVYHCLTLMGARLRELGVKVTVDVADGLVVKAEEVRLEQVLVNLLQNACDALSEVNRREVFIAAELSDAGIEMRIRDTGPGIAPEILPRLFDSFFTTKPPGLGLGLGLSISRDIIREFGGRIEAINSPEGGAVFVLWLPIP